MLKSGLSSVLGFLLLLGVVATSILERGQGEIRYFDWHAAVVVLGGVCGSLLIAVKGGSFLSMLRDWFGVIFGRDTVRSELGSFKQEMISLENSWKDGRRSEVLDLIEKGGSVEVRTAAQALVQHLQPHRLQERFESLRTRCEETYLPQIEGWDLVARLAPSFGIVGTVAGMVQLFRNMASNQGNLGGAMALALLATLYGILLGTAVGGPMSTRLNQLLNERLSAIDLLEAQVRALMEEDRYKKGSPS